MPLSRRQRLELAIAVSRGLVPLSMAQRVIMESEGAPSAADGGNLVAPDPLGVIPRADRDEIVVVAARIWDDPAAIEETLSTLNPIAARETSSGHRPPGETGRHYAIRRELARGGGGRVMVAMDARIGREVAYKELLDPAGAGGRDRSAPLPSEVDIRRERFLREARVTGQLEHPNIVPVYEIGENASGGLFYTMKLVRGRTLRDRILEIQTDMALSREEKYGQRMKLLDAFVDVCQALAYAHSRGVINRDLKPANVMIGDFGETVVLDWGLARVTGHEDLVRGPGEAGPVTLATESHAGLTMTGQVIGTPLYMSPEQARGSLGDVSERSDVYSLGMILYEIVTGYPPWDDLDPRTVVANVLTCPPVPILQREPLAAPELVAIIERATVKDPRRRMDGARQLAEEVLAYRDGRSLTVYRYSLWQQLNRLVRRHQAASSAAALVILALTAALATALVYGEIARGESEAAREALQRAQEAEAEARASAAAEKAASEAARQAYRHAEGQRLSTVAQSVVAENPGLALLLALEAARRSPGLQANNAMLSALAALSEVRRYGVMDGYVRTAVLSPDGAQIATGADDHTARVFDAATGAERLRLERHRGRVTRVEWSRDGRRLLTVAGGRAAVWNLDGSEAGLPAEEGAADAAWMGDSHSVGVAGTDGSVRLWTPGSASRLLASGAAAAELACTPDGGRVLVRRVDGTSSLLEAATGTVLATMPAALAALSADGSASVAVAADGTTAVIDTRDGRERARFPSAPPNTAARLALSADGRLMVYASTSATGTIRTTATGAPVRTFAWPATLGAVALSPDGSTIAFGVHSRILWEETETGRLVGRLQGHEYDVEALSFSPDGTRLLSASRDRTAALWRRPGEALPRVADSAGRDILALDPSTRRLLVLDPSGIAFTGAGRELLAPPPAAGVSASFDGSGARAILWSPADTRIRVFRFAPTLEETVLTTAAALRRASLSPGGSFASAVCMEGSIHVWDAATGRAVTSFQADGFSEDDLPSAVAVSADGSRIALGHGGRAEFSVWTAEGRLVRRLQGHTGFALAAAFTPDGRRIVTTAADASARVWDLESSGPPAYFRWPRIEETVPVVSTDGTRVLVVGGGEARLVSLSGQEEQVSYRFPGGVAHAVFGSDGQSVLIADSGGEVRRYPIEFLAVAEAAAPREILPAELARYEVGSSAERLTRAAEYEARHPSASAANRRGMAALFAGRLDEAVEQFRGAAKLLPWHPDAWVSLATALCRRAAARNGPEPARAEDLSDALTALETAVSRGLDGTTLAGDPDLAVLRADPRFSAICAPPGFPPR